MKPIRRNLLAAVGSVGVVLLFAFAPVVPITVRFSIPYNTTPSGVTYCNQNALSNETSYLQCLLAHNYPPENVTGYSSLLYAATGLGTAPYPSEFLATQGSKTVLLHMVGSRIGYFETEFVPATVLNPSGVVEVRNTSIAQYAFGLLNFSATVVNLSDKSLMALQVGFDYPTYGTNVTYDGLVGHTTPFVECAAVLPAGKTCSTSMLLNQSSSLLTGQTYPLTLEVWSGSNESRNQGLGYPFLFLHHTQAVYPGVGLNPFWVKSFITAVNQERNATALAEDKGLDAFAAYRYNTLRSQYDISDYNFTQDYVKYFHTTNVNITEEILYPGNEDPALFPKFLHDYAPGHWLGLMNPDDKKFGYFFGTGPTVVVAPGCSATEIPGPNINITAYVIEHDCSYIVADQIWFIIMVGP